MCLVARLCELWLAFSYNKEPSIESRLDHDSDDFILFDGLANSLLLLTLSKTYTGGFR